MSENVENTENTEPQEGVSISGRVIAKPQPAVRGKVVGTAGGTVDIQLDHDVAEESLGRKLAEGEELVINVPESAVKKG